jgi:hypothetical protein
MWLLIALRRSAPRPALRIAVAALLIMGAVIAPWTWRNYRATGHFVLITTGFNDAFLRGLVFTQTDYALLRRPPYTDAENATNAWFNSLAAAEGKVWQADDYETEQILGREVRRQVRDAPGKVVRKVAVGLFTFWYEMTSFRNSLITGACALLAWIFAAVGARRAWHEDRAMWVFLLPAVYLNVLLAVLLALGRYSAPIMPALLCATAFGVDTVLDRLGFRSRHA